MWRLILNPKSIDEFVRRPPTTAGWAARIAVVGWQVGALVGAVTVSGSEPFRDWCDYGFSFFKASLVFGVLLAPLSLALANSVGVPFRGQTLHRELSWHRLMLAAPLSFMLPFAAWMAAALVAPVREPVFGFYDMAKPAWAVWRGWTVLGSGPVVGLVVLAMFLHGAAAMRRLKRAGEWQICNRCLSCGYNLTGLTSGICPECGKAAPWAIRESQRPR